MDQETLFGTEYRCILMDPPWMERGGGKCKRGADRHYGLMDARKVASVVQASPGWRPAKDAHLWCWATDNYLEDGLWLVRELGFRYVRTWVWVKWSPPASSCVCGAPERGFQVGLGQYARGSHELLLLSTRGRACVPPPGARGPSVFFARRTEYSRKPDEAFAVVERVSPGPRLEMFARTARKGWDCWGNEAPGGG